MKNIENLIIYKKTIPAREAVCSDFPKALNSEIVDYLTSHNINKLYSHQVEMFEKSQLGENIVITTSTASGKTLSFLLPVLQEILKNPQARAIFIYPTKALAADQYRSLQHYIKYFGEHRISAGVYDGDTPPSERSRIRKTANIILTNPEMINGSFLPNHSRYGFDFVFTNLKYIVVDELHSYRGIFGSHFANIFKRLRRVCNYYKSKPQFLCSSATIANPIELAENICGRKFTHVFKDGSSSSERNYFLVQPPNIVNYKGGTEERQRTTSVAVEMIPKLVENNNSFIAFAQSRKDVEIMLRESRDVLNNDNFMGHSYSNKISGYRGGYTPMERKQIESKMINKELNGLISTNALELGIDIGKVDTTVLVGFPGTRASFWQQTGRAGRSKNKCNNYLILDNRPIDQYVGINPNWLFENSNENAIIDPSNLFIQIAHVRSAAAELPLTLEDISIFPELGEILPTLIRVGELNNKNGKFMWTGNAFPAGDYSLRNIDKERFKLINKENNSEITDMSKQQAFLELYENAIYLHDGLQYQIVTLDLESKTAFAIPFSGDYYTEPFVQTVVKIIKELQAKEYGRCAISFGDINVESFTDAFKQIQFHNRQNMGFEELANPLSTDYDTESIWIKLPHNVVDFFMRINTPLRQQLSKNRYFTYLDGLGYALQNATTMTTMSDYRDVGVAYDCVNSDNDTRDIFIFIYDKYVGGLGYAEKAYELISDIIDNAIKLVANCSCKDGCVACVGDYELDKKVVLWGLKNLLKELKEPKGIKTVEPIQVTEIHKQFKFDELSEKWTDFCTYISEIGENTSNFLVTIPYVEIDNGTITLFTTNDFYKSWILDNTNAKRIKNIFKTYTECTHDIVIDVKTTQETDDLYIKEKIKMRYQKLKDKS